MSEALEDLNKVLENAPSDKVAVADRECLSALKMSSSKAAIQAAKDEEKEPKKQQSPIIAMNEKQVYDKANQALSKLIS
jgi:hypothetical protein